MNSLDDIRNKLMQLYRKNPNVHINAVIAHPKMYLKNEAVVIKGVYPHIFQVAERKGKHPQTHTFQYSDVLLHTVEIIELGYI